MKRTLSLIFILVFYISAGAQTLAEDTLCGHTTGVVVVRAKCPDERETVPGQKLDGKQLERLGGHNVADAIRYFSGVQIKDYGGIGGLKTINVHGIGSEHVGIVYNGIPIENAQNGQIDLGRFSLDNLESISLYTGGNSDIFQPARNFASSSVVFLQTRKPFFESDSVAGFRQTKPYNLKGTFRTGSFDLANPLVRWEQRWNDDVSSSLSAEYMYTSGRYKYRYHLDGGYDTTATRHNGDVKALRCDANLFGDLHHGYWRAQGYVYSSRRGLPGAVVRNRFSHVDRQNDLNTFAQFSFRKDISRYSLLLNAKYAYDYLHYMHHPQKKGDGKMRVDNSFRQQQVYLSVAQRYEVVRNWDVSLSADYVMNGLEADLYRFVRPLRHSFYGALATAWHTNRLATQANVLFTSVNNRIRYGKSPSDADFTEITPSVYLNFTPFPAHKMTLRAFVKRMFRMPTLNDLYYMSVGNSNLQPEYTMQYDLGLTCRKVFRNDFLRAVEFKADGYYNKVTDKIVAVPTTNLFRWTMMNIGRAEIFGTDLVLDINGGIGSLALKLKTTYTYQCAEDCSNRRSKYYRGQIPYIPKHSVSAIIGAEWKGWALNYSFLYTGKRYDASANTPANYVHPWRTNDLSLSRNLRIGHAHADLMLQLNNIFNQHYEVVRCYPMPGRNFRLTASIGI